MPPSTQGFVALEMLNIMEGFDIAALGHNSADYLHVVSEAKRIAFADRGAYLADRDHMPKDVLQTLISKDYAAARRSEIDMNEGRARALLARRRDFAGRDRGDTVYLTAADGHGNVDLVHPVAVRQLRRRLRRRRHRHHAAQPRLGLHAAAPDIPTRSARTSGRCTRWCRR